MANENYDTGGTGGAIFGGPQGAMPVKTKPGMEAMGDDYRAPQGLPEWKQPEFDTDDRVDPTKYPEPKSGPAAKFLGRFFPDPTQQGLAVGKTFYLFFFSAFGSLFPLISVYFKQLGMDSAQAGFLAGIRPMIEYLATPFWSKISDRFRKGKVMLLIAVASWILFTLPIGFLHPPVVYCKVYNATTGEYMLEKPHYESHSIIQIRKRRSVHLEEPLSPETVDELPRALPFVMENHELSRR